VGSERRLLSRINDYPFSRLGVIECLQSSSTFENTCGSGSIRSRLDSHAASFLQSVTCNTPLLKISPQPLTTFVAAELAAVEIVALTSGIGLCCHTFKAPAETTV
jgi:hypothetical protein